MRRDVRRLAGGLLPGGDAMSDRPIIFSSSMVRALLAGTKTQTRRFQFDERGRLTTWGKLAEEWARGERGQRVWARETWGMNRGGYDVPALIPKQRPARDKLRDDQLVYFATETDSEILAEMPRRPSIHMPRWASRLTLAVTDVRVERLNEISRTDAIAEGCDSPLTGTEAPTPGPGVWLADERTSFAILWNGLHGPGAWGANPWVVAVSFEIRLGNIDEVTP